MLLLRRFVQFQPTLPARGATGCARRTKFGTRYFNPRSPHGERHHKDGRTTGRLISTHAPRTGSDERDLFRRDGGKISTHAPRTGSDYFLRFTHYDSSISTHAPRTGSDGGSPSAAAGAAFQPTLPARGATPPQAAHSRASAFQPTLPARGATPPQAAHSRASAFQPTLPARGATPSSSIWAMPFVFQPTLPARGATGRLSKSRTRSGNFNPRSPHGERLGRFRSRLSSGEISTHAPRTGSDVSLRSDAPTGADISTHAPRTGSDAPAWQRPPRWPPISTHAPRTGSDRLRRDAFPSGRYFNPRSPHGERRTTAARSCGGCTFQPTLPARGATAAHAEGLHRRADFNPRSPHGERRECGWRCSSGCHFNPRSPHGERQRKVTILSIRIIGFAQKVYHKTVLLRISLAENAVILPEKP